MADKRIDELEEALTITANDLFVLEQANVAKKLSGQTMTAMLTALANGHGGISTIAKTSSSGTNPVVDTYTITYADGTSSTFTVTNGLKGDTGSQGVQGPAGADATITSTSVMYQEWTSGTTYPTGTWVANPPAVAQGNYLWTRTIVNYSDGGQTVAYSVSRMGIDGSGAVSTVCNVSPDGNGNVALTASDVGALPTTYQAPVTSVNAKTGTVALTASDVSAVPVSGSNGFLYRSSNTIGEKELNKTLYESNSGWSSGDLTVSGISNYSTFLLNIANSGGTIYNIPVFGCFTTNQADLTPNYFRAFGMSVASNTLIHLTMVASVSGDKLTMSSCNYIAGTTVSTGQKVMRIVGVI